MKYILLGLLGIGDILGGVYLQSDWGSFKQFVATGMFIGGLGTLFGTIIGANLED